MKKIILIIFGLLMFNNYCNSQNYYWNLLSARGHASHMFLFPNNKGWIYGGNIAYKTTNNGDTWSNSIMLNFSIGGSYFFSGVFFIDSLYGWSVNADENIKKSINGGMSWSNISIISGNSLFKICFVNRLTGWVAGESGFQGRIYKTTNGGVNWFVQLNNNYNSRISGLKMFNENKGFFFSNYSDTIGYTFNGGSNWQLIKVGSVYTIDQVFFIDSLNGWAVGMNRSILKTTNGGMNWLLLNNNLNNNPSSLYFSNINTGWIGLPDGRIYKSTNSGLNWFVQAAYTYYSEEESHVQKIFFKNENTGFALVSSGTVAKTTNGGTNWNDCINTPIGDISSVSFEDGYNGIMVSNYGSGYLSFIWRTSNKGQNWIAVDTSRYNLACVKMLNSNTGFICCNNNNLSTSQTFIKKTVNGGSNWDSVSLSGVLLKSLSFLNEYNGWCCGYAGNVYKTTNCGVNWIPGNVGINELVNCVSFTDELSGVAVMNGGKILKTINGGLNWVNTSPNADYNYNKVQMTSTNIGYVIGYKYWTQQYTYYTNRIVLKTTNGGNNWISLGVTTIQLQHPYNDLCFLNDSLGWFAFDEGQIVVTRDGGITWATDANAPDGVLCVNFINENNGWAAGKRGIFLSTASYTGIINYSISTSSRFSLSQNYPNPFNPTTNIKFQITNNKYTTLKVYDILGKEIAILVNEKLKPREYEVTFDGSIFPSGVYFYKLQSGEYTETKKMLLIK